MPCSAETDLSFRHLLKKTSLLNKGVRFFYGFAQCEISIDRTQKRYPFLPKDSAKSQNWFEPERNSVTLLARKPEELFSFAHLQDPEVSVEIRRLIFLNFQVSILEQLFNYSCNIRKQDRSKF